jgi:uncharacterized protein YjiK
MANEKQRELARELLGSDPAVSLTQASRTRLDLSGGVSGVVPLGGGRFAIVDDDKGIYEVADAASGGEVERVLSSKRHRALDDLEGICRAPGDGALLALSERSGVVLRIALDGSGGVDPAAEPQKLGKLPKIGKGRNKGWEGLDLLPAALSPDGAERLVAVHEGFPRKVGLVRLPDLDDPVLLDLPPEVDEDDALDLSDVAVDPATGHLFVLSDESATILELSLSDQPWCLAGLAVHRLDLSRKEKAEALAFEGPETLWLGTDRKAFLYELRVERD